MRIALTGASGRLGRRAAAVTAAVRAGVGHILYTSLPRPEAGNPAIVAADHHATEDAILASGADWTFLCNSLYAEARVGNLAGAATTGTYMHNSGSGRAADVAREDCAAAAAAALLATSHAGRVYDITGPELLGADAIAALFSTVTGREVTPLDLDDATYEKNLRALGIPEFAVPVVITFGAAIRAGYLDVISDDVEALTGRPPRPLIDLLR